MAKANDEGRDPETDDDVLTYRAAIKAIQKPTEAPSHASTDPVTGKAAWVQHLPGDSRADKSGNVYTPGPPDAKIKPGATTDMGETKYQYDPSNKNADQNGWFPIGKASPRAASMYAGVPATGLQNFPDGTPPDAMAKAYGAEGTMARSIMLGRQKRPSDMAMARSPYLKGVMDKVYQMDPQWSEQRGEIRKALTTGTDGRNIGNLNTAVVHLDALGEIANALDNGSFQPGNDLWNRAKTIFGEAAPTDYEGLRQAVAGEMDAALHGTSTIPGRDEILKTMPTKNSPGQMAGIINTNLATLGQKLTTYQQRYEQQIPEDTAWSPVLPHARAVMQRHGLTQQRNQQAPPPGTTQPGNYAPGFHPIGAH